MHTLCFFCCSMISPGKNHIRLIDAFRQAFSNRELQLVIAGIEERRCVDIMEHIRSAEAAGHVKYAGAVDMPTRDALYQECLFSVFPSLKEGFDMPVVEAAQFGKPVLTAQDSPMAEFGGDAVLLCNPHSVNELAEKCRALYEDEQLRLTLASRSRQLLDRVSPQRVSAAISEFVARVSRA